MGNITSSASQYRTSASRYTVPETKEGDKSVFDLLVCNLNAKDILRVESSYKVFLKFASTESQASKAVELWKYADGFTHLRNKLEESPHELVTSLNNAAASFFYDPAVTRMVAASILTNAIKLFETAAATGGSTIALSYIDYALDQIKSSLEKGLDANEVRAFGNSQYMTSYIARFTQLSHLVDNDHAMLAFQTFLANEYSSENVDFYEAVNRYKFKYDPDNGEENHAFADYITQMFISEDSPLQVNIESKMRSRIERHVRKMRTVRSLFDSCQQEIYLLMGRDSWTRFKHSTFWEDMLISYPPVLADGSPLKDEDSHHLRTKKFQAYIGDDSLEVIMSSKVGREQLDRYVRMWNKRDGSVSFLHDVQRLDHEEHDGAQGIYDNYFTIGSKMYLSLSRSIMKQVENTEKSKLCKKTFDRAVSAVYKNFKNKHTVQKFKETGLYTKYCHMRTRVN